VILVLYEDKRNEAKNFGLHHFVVQLVLDELGSSESHWGCKKVAGIPAGGDSKLRRRCQRDLTRLSNRYSKVFAVYDQDKILKLLDKPAGLCRPKICELLKEGCDPAEKLDVVLINANTESILKTIRDSGLVETSGDKFQRAIEKGSGAMAARDSIFINCAQQPIKVRQQIVGEIPDLQRLVRRIAQELVDE